jgi:hypothetical protein
MIAHVNFEDIKKGFESVGERMVDTCLVESIYADLDPWLNQVFDFKLGAWLKAKKE